MAEPRTPLRKEILSALGEFGLTKNVEATGNLNKVHEKLANGGLDLLICDTVLPEGDLLALIKSVRFGETKGNPFMVIITLVSDPTAELLGEIMDCGPDAILVKPFTADQLIKRIQNLSNNRKRFVVTSSYVGPERRQGHREDTIGLETIRVPNPLFDKIFGVENIRLTQRAAKTAITRINNRIVEGHFQRANELISNIFPSPKGINWTAKKLNKLRELQTIAFDLNKRISMTDYLSLGGLIMTLNRMLKDVHNWTNKENESDLKLLRILGEILQQDSRKSDLPNVQLYPPVENNKKLHSN